MRCHLYKNLMVVVFVLVMLNVSFLTYTLLTTNFSPTEERPVEGKSILGDGNWRTRVPLFGKSVENILDQLSHGPRTPVFLYKPVCRSGSCTRYSGLELKKIFRENGLDIVEKNDKDWTVSLTNGVSGVPKVSKVWQYTNIIPGLSNVCLREKLCLRLGKLSERRDLDDFHAFPKCFIIDGNVTLKNNELTKGYWLLRKAGSLRGSSEGLTILSKNDVLSLLKKKKGQQMSRTKGRKTLYQTRALTSIEQYIHEPFLVNKRKHLLRFYLLVKSIDPLRVYISDFGDVAFSQMPYKVEVKNDSCVHLDVYTAPWCTKNLDSPSKAWDVNGPESLVWTLKYYWSVLSHKSIDVSHTAAQVRDALLQTAILMASTSSEILDNNYSKEKAKYLALKKNGFVLFHVKILLDNNRKPHVIDVDCDPGFQTLGSETFRAKQMTMLIQDLIKLSGSFRRMYDRKPYKEKLTDNLLSFCSNRGGCSEEEIQTIITFEDERHNSGSFRLLYPHPSSVNSHKKTIKDMKLDSVLPEYVDQIRKF